MYALESLAQSTSLETPGLITTAPLDILDAPEFPMRGLMINPSIQYLPIPFLKVRTTNMHLQFPLNATKNVTPCVPNTRS